MKHNVTTKLYAFFLAIMLLTLSASCHKSGSGMNTPRETNVPDEIVGAWYYGDVSSTEIISNGSWSNAVGSGMSYTFHKDGTFEFGYRNYAMVGTCSNIGMAYRRGTFIMNGNQVTLYDNYAKIMEQHSCEPSHNYDKNMDKTSGEVLVLRSGQDDYGNPGLYIGYPNGNPNFFQKK